MKSTAAGKSSFSLITVSTCVCHYSSKKKYIYQISMVVLAKIFIGETHVLTYQSVQMGTIEKVSMGEQNHGEKNEVGEEKQMASMLLIML